MHRASRQIQREILGAHRLFHTSDIDRARHRVAGKFCAHKLTPGTGHSHFEVCHNHAAGKQLSLNYLRYGSEVTINPGELTHFYLIQIPLRGSALVRNGRQTVAADHRTASVLNPTRDTLMTWSPGCEKLLLQIDATAMQQAAESLIDHHLPQAVVFNSELPLHHPFLQDWYSMLWKSVEQAQQDAAFNKQARTHQEALEHELITGLLLAQRSSISHMLSPTTSPPRACQVLRAKRFITTHLSEPITITQIARASGGSIRNLQLGFKAECDCSPKQYLLQRRLDYARYLLQSESADALVSDIAFDAGFSHLGRFSIAYRERFRESPRDTLFTSTGAESV